MRIRILTLVAGLHLSGCMTPANRQVANPVPYPATTLYDANSTARNGYRDGFANGFNDMVAGRSTINTSTRRTESSDARLHGYSDGAIRGLKVARPSETERPLVGRFSSKVLPDMYEDYGEWGQSASRFKWHGF